MNNLLFVSDVSSLKTEKGENSKLIKCLKRITQFYFGEQLNFL